MSISRAPTCELGAENVCTEGKRPLLRYRSPRPCQSRHLWDGPNHAEARSVEKTTSEDGGLESGAGVWCYCNVIDPRFRWTEIS